MCLAGRSRHGADVTDSIVGERNQLDNRGTTSRPSRSSVGGRCSIETISLAKTLLGARCRHGAARCRRVMPYPLVNPSGRLHTDRLYRESLRVNSTTRSTLNDGRHHDGWRWTILQHCRIAKRLPRSVALNSPAHTRRRGGLSHLQVEINYRSEMR